jgi:hypothetical protein
MQIFNKLRSLKRKRLSRKYIMGKGIEIGALHNPLWVSDRAHVRYIDRLDMDTLRLHYPTLNDFKLAKVDIIDNGETLETIGDESLDFIIGNHMLEHCENPIGTIRNHLSKLKNNGIMYYAIPDKRLCFDVNRPYTSFEHLITDDKYGPEISRREHYYEWTKYSCSIALPDEIESVVKKLLEMNQSIHFHVWDVFSYYTFLVDCKKYLNGCFEIICYYPNGNEIIAILKKTMTINQLQFPRIDRYYQWSKYASNIVMPDKIKSNKIISRITMLISSYFIKYLNIFY